MEHYVPLIGILVQTAVFMLGGYAMVVRTGATTEALKEEIQDMNAELKELKNVIVVQAVQTARLDNMREHLTMLQRNYEDLRRGNGWVTQRSTVDGEYP